MPAATRRKYADSDIPDMEYVMADTMAETMADTMAETMAETMADITARFKIYNFVKAVFELNLL